MRRRWERGLIVWSGGGLASGLLAAGVWAQSPVPASGPAPAGYCEPARPGPIRRAFGHTYRVLQDNFIGYPSEFIEPPPGFYVNETLAVMKAKADPHRFTLYRTDFLDGTDKLSPVGASRFNIMAPRIVTWPGPVLIEWVPENPGLAESRRQAVLALLNGGGIAMIPERVAVGPTPFPGNFGTHSANSYNVLLGREQSAPSQYSLPPAASASFGGGGGGPP
jgi:hypothetical protein